MASTQEILQLVERFSALGQFRGLPLAQAPPKGRANPDKSCAAQDQKRADSVSHAIAGTQSAMMRSRTQICQDTWTPATKVPSASRTRSPNPVAAEVSIF